MAALWAATAAAAPLTATPTRAFPIGSFFTGATNPGGYAPGFDGTFWTVAPNGPNGGIVGHVDDEGNHLGDGFTFNRNGFYPLDVGYFGGRVFITLGGDPAKMISVATGGGHQIVTPDPETVSRLGNDQKALRTFSDGTALLGFGQANKIATLNLDDNTAGHPWYPQSFMGTGINSGEDTFFETCMVGPGAVGGEAGEPARCGTRPGFRSGLDYPMDIAPSAGGLYVVETEADRVTRILTEGPGGSIGYRFGQGPGAAAGQLDSPVSIVRQGGSGNLYVSETGNRRISVFDPSGNFVAAIGYGVLDGTNAMQVCGLEIGPCRSGVAHQTNPRSYFTQLDFGPGGELYAYMPLVGEVQVFSVSGSGGGDGGGPAPAGPGPGAQAAGPAGPGVGQAPGVERIRLGAAPLKVAKGQKTTLTATINSGASCAARLVLFQVKDGRWQSLGKAVKPGRGCRASRKTRVAARSVFRAVLIDAANHATLATSSSVTVKRR